MQIQRLKTSDLELFYTYAKEEQWDIEDIHIRTLLKIHPDDFFIFYENEELLGYVVALKESSEFGFISSLLVLKKFRSLGYGAKIFSIALTHLKNCQIALDSVLGQEKFYEKFGFKAYFDVNTYMFQTGELSIQKSKTLEVSSVDKEDSLRGQSKYFKSLLLDKNVSYRAIKEHTDSFAFAFAYKDGYKITIQSEDVNHALSLFFALCQNYENKTAVYLQSSMQNTMLEALAQALGMKRVLHSTRMYNKILAS
ncbi:GNAT family N-acetyltransferase [Sulfurimonas sp. SAG-AH-194-C21]|nr:GNAT family N-acetyltransferase [Sulfurimonas sp. SAG-AH-194-C21]MDF1883119.1 GNAT family N-acetyltransferase [Sulfurimonas sp. SAG-AH-194-C21]